MNMISEQITYLRGYITSDENLYDALHEAADTIESLSAKLDELAVRLMVQENLRSGEMAMKGLLDGFGLNSDAIEASSAKLADKERLVEDCGGGWIKISDRLPTMEECQKNDNRFILDDGNRRYQGVFDYTGDRFVRFTFESVNGAIGMETDKCAVRWHNLPEPPCHEP